MAKVVWTEIGRLWLQEAIGYVAQGNRKKAARLKAQAFAKTRQLRRNPQIGRIVPEFAVDYIRELLMSPFRILYLYQDNVCSIVAVIHERRNLLSVLRLEDLEDAAFG